MNIKRSILMAAASAAFVLCGVAAADAGPWQWHHPRRVEVNHRLAHQDFRINRAEREGRISPREAWRLHREDRGIRREERFASRFGNSHISRAEQRSLNQQENGVSRQIYNEAH